MRGRPSCAALFIANAKGLTARMQPGYQPGVHTPFLGPSYNDNEIESAMKRSTFPFEKIDQPESAGGSDDRPGTLRRLVSGTNGIRAQGPGQPFAAGRPCAAMTFATSSIVASSTESHSGHSAHQCWLKMPRAGS